MENFNIVAQALEMANKNGAFGLADSHKIFSALQGLQGELQAESVEAEPVEKV